MEGEGTLPLVVHVPHSSREIPDEVRAGLALSDADLEAEILRVTDHFTDKLCGRAAEIGAVIVVNRLSRLVVDPERFREDADEVMAAGGAGAVYVRASDGRPLRDPAPTAAERERLLAAYFDPYARAVEGVVREILDRFDRCLILDAHSFPRVPLSWERDQDPKRPLICLGTDPFHTPPEVTAALEALCLRSGRSFARDHPFRGTYVPMCFWRKDRRVRSIMIEVRRDSYMDEQTGERAPAYDATLSFLSDAIEISADWARGL